MKYPTEVVLFWKKKYHKREEKFSYRTIIIDYNLRAEILTKGNNLANANKKQEAGNFHQTSFLAEVYVKIEFPNFIAIWLVIEFHKFSTWLSRRI